MSEIGIEEVYVVMGDGSNRGSRILGVFTDLEKASRNTVGCGSLEIGGDGHVERRYACKIDDKYYILEDKEGYINGEMLRSHAEQLNYVIIKIHKFLPEHKIKLIRILRMCGFSLFSSSKILKNPQKFMLTESNRFEIVKMLQEIGVEFSHTLTRDLDIDLVVESVNDRIKQS